MWNINAPQGHIPCAIFTKFAEFVRRFRMRSLLKFGWICSKSYGVMGVLSCRFWYPEFSAPPSGDTMRQTPNVLEVQERARGPLSPCQVWWGGARISPPPGGQKRLVFCLFVCLFVSPKPQKIAFFSPTEGDRINRSRRYLARKSIPWVCYSTPNLALSVKRGRYRGPQKSKFAQNCVF